MLWWMLACVPENNKPVESDPVKESVVDSGDSGDSTPPVDYTAAFEEIRTQVNADLRRSDFATAASVAIWYKGEVIFAEGFGTAHPGEEVEVLPTTLFQIGSDTKKLTAMALLQKVQAGKIGLDDSLAETLPNFQPALDPENPAQVSLRELISHQTAWYDYTPWIDDPGDERLAEVGYGRFAENMHAYAPSGTYWNYSNPNFSMAGLVVEELDDRAYGDILAEDIFVPLGMTRSFSRQSEAEADGDYAYGNGLILPNGIDTFVFGEELDYELGVLDMEHQLDAGFTRPAGLVWSTATDMAILGGFLMNGNSDVLYDSLLQELTTPQVPMYPFLTGQDYGFGLMIFDGFGAGRNRWVREPLWAHGGNTMGMTSTFYLLPERDFAISILSNGYGDNFANSAVLAMDRIAGLPEASEQTAAEPPLSDLSEYAGTWDDPHGIGQIILSWDGAELVASVPSLEAAGSTIGAVTPVAKDFFYVNVDGYDYDITFYDGEDGTAHKYLRNRSFGGTRVDIRAQAARGAVRPARLLPPLMDPIRQLEEADLTTE